jgi:polar amino acid transport system substrate-binding protein
MGCAASIAAVTTALTLASGEPTVIGTEAPFPPYTYVDESGVLSGFDHEVAEEVCRRARLTCTWRITEFDKLLPGVMSGEFDIVVGGISHTPERSKLVDFTVDYSIGAGVDDFVGRPGAPAPDLARLGVQSGTIQEQHLADTGRRYTTFPSEKAMLDALVSGQIDLAFGSYHYDAVASFFEAHDIDWLYQEDTGESGVGMAVCKGNSALLQRLDAALEAMLSDGTIDEMSGRWF